MVRCVGWGIIGSGKIATQMAQDMARTPHARLVAVAARDPGRTRQFATIFGARAHDDIDALLADPEVEAVYVATPTALHVEHALRVIAAGKAVLCEKPLAGDAAGARRIEAAARAAGVFCMEAMWTRFLPIMAILRDRVAAGEIGRVVGINASLGYPQSRPGLRHGAMIDLGVYGVSIAHMLLGAPSSVAAHGILAGDTVVQANAVLGYRGASVSVAASHVALLRNDLQVVGETGRIDVEAPFIKAMRLRQVPYPAPSDETPAGTGRMHRVKEGVQQAIVRAGLWHVVRHAGRRLTGRDGQATDRSFHGNGFRFELDEVARCLEAGLTESPVIPLAESVAVMQTVDRIQADVNAGLAAA